jgi:hypothetical protein
VDEAIGEIALKAGRFSDAETAFRAALSQLPASSRSVKGLAEASKGNSKTSGAAGQR